MPEREPTAPVFIDQGKGGTGYFGGVDAQTGGKSPCKTGLAHAQSAPESQHFAAPEGLCKLRGDLFGLRRGGTDEFLQLVTLLLIWEKSEQTQDLTVLVHIDLIGSRYLGQTGHGHDVAGLDAQ